MGTTGGNVTSHVSDGRLNALLDGELGETDAAAIRSHVASCATCRQRLDQAQRFLEQAADVLGDPQPPAPPDGAASLPPASPAASAADAPARRPSKTAKEVAVDLDGATQQSPAIRSNVDEGPPLFRGRQPRRGFDATSLAWAATIALAVGVGYLANEVLHARATMRGAARPAGGSPAGAAAAAPVAAGGAPEVAAPAVEAKPALPPPKTLNPRGTVSVLGHKRLDGRPGAAAVARPALRRASMEQAVIRLGGAIRLLDGMRSSGVLMGPGSLVAGASGDRDVVRILYRAAGQPVSLDQQRVGAGGAGGPAGGAAAAANGITPGDTLFATAPDGKNAMRWLDERGFWLSITARLPPDSLRRLATRVR